MSVLSRVAAAGTDVVVRYQPRGAAKQLLECTAGEVLIAGPAGTGKSMAMLFKLHLACMKVPGVRALLVRQTHASLTGTTLVTFERQVAAPTLANATVRWFGGSAREPAAYRYSNGSTLLVGGLDRPEKFLSSEFDLVAVDEGTEITETALETLISRLRGKTLRHKQIILACNPDAPTHFLQQRADLGKMVMLHSRHEDNPLLFDELFDRAGVVRYELTEFGRAYMAKLDSLTGVRYLRLRKGIWAAAEGVIYEEWNPAVHLVDRFEVPADWQRFWVVDFGYVNPFVLQCWAEDPDGQLVMYRELYRTKRLVEDHARDIMACVSDPDPDHRPAPGDIAASGRVWREPRPRVIVCDHDAEGRATLAKQLNLPTRAAGKAVLDGIQRMQARLRFRADGRPGMVFMRDSLVFRDPELVDAKKPTCTVEEIPGYVWLIRPGQVGAQKSGKEEPLKENDHGCDAARYFAMYRDPARRPGIRTT